MAKIKKNICDYGMPEYYKEFKSKYPKDECPIDAKKFKDVLSGYWSMIADNYEVKYPIKFGYLKIVKEKRRIKFYKGKATNLMVDWGATNKLWAEDPKAKEEKKLRFNTNEHTDGYMYKFWWDRRTSTVKNLSAYSFKMNRTTSRKLAAAVKSGDSSIDYFEKPTMKVIVKR
jgi:hypothetical protein